jgi:4-hydroxybenzoate polyprenyltransferase
MTITTMAHLPHLKRLLVFVQETHPPLTYTLVAVTWSVSLIALLEWAHGSVQFTLEAGLLAIVFFLMLLYLRAVDEVKDLNYDRRYNPSRPLVRGAITSTEIKWLAAGVSVVIIAISLRLGANLVCLAILQMAYAIALWVLERRSRLFRESILLNLWVTFPVSATLNLYVVIYLAERGLIPPLPDVIAIVAAHMSIFLHLEFGRKLKKPAFSAPGENGYARVLGVYGAMSVCVFFGLIACVLVSWQLWQGYAGLFSLLPWVALIPSAIGMIRFHRTHDHAPALKSYFGTAMIAFFLLNIVAVLSSIATG